jgi:hypothetical protein
MTLNVVFATELTKFLFRETRAEEEAIHVRTVHMVFLAIVLGNFE